MTPEIDTPTYDELMVDLQDAYDRFAWAMERNGRLRETLKNLYQMARAYSEDIDFRNSAIKIIEDALADH